MARLFTIDPGPVRQRSVEPGANMAPRRMWRSAFSALWPSRPPAVGRANRVCAVDELRRRMLAADAGGAKHSSRRSAGSSSTNNRERSRSGFEAGLHARWIREHPLEEAAFSDHVVLHRSGRGRGPLTILRPKKARAPHSPRADPAQQATPLANLDRVGRPIGPGPPPRCPVDRLREARARSGEDPVLPWSRPLVWQERRQPTTAGCSLGPHASIARQGRAFR